MGMPASMGAREMAIGERTMQETIRAMVSQSVLLSGNKNDNSQCEEGIISFPNRKTIRGQTAQGLYEITPREELAKMNELTRTVTLSIGYKQEWRTRAQWTDSLEGTVV
jgi:hypothetical protein